jgi:hypothetical protein
MVRSGNMETWARESTLIPLGTLSVFTIRQMAIYRHTAKKKCLVFLRRAARFVADK